MKGFPSRLTFGKQHSIIFLSIDWETLGYDQEKKFQYTYNIYKENVLLIKLYPLITVHTIIRIHCF